MPLQQVSYVLTVSVSEEFYTGGGDSQSPRPVPFSLLLRHAENTLALFFLLFLLGCCFFCVVGYPPNWGKRPRYIDVLTDWQ